MKTLYASLLIISAILLSAQRVIAITSIAAPIVIQVESLPSRPTPTAVRAYVASQAILEGISSTVALFIVDHESQDGVNMRGDDGQSRGYWMISKVWHPEVSDACADDLACSTAWSLAWIKAGHIDQWSTWKYRCKWFGYCQ